jgi:hypothetical protein
MKKKARSYSVDFKQEAVRRMAQATTIIGLAKEGMGDSLKPLGADSDMAPHLMVSDSLQRRV